MCLPLLRILRKMDKEPISFPKVDVSKASLSGIELPEDLWWEDLGVDQGLKLVTDKALLADTCFKTPTEENIKKLLEILEQTRTRAFGYAANQFGLKERFFVARIGEDLRVFKNPTIIEKKMPAANLKEGCVSFLGMGAEGLVTTLRYNVVKLKHDDGTEKFVSTNALVVQHETDHLDGLTIFDRALKDLPHKVEKISPNAPCPCGSGKKFKKCCA